MLMISLERMTDNQEMEDIQSYFRCHCFTKLIKDIVLLNHLKRSFKEALDGNLQKFNLLTRKEVYSYDYFTSFEKFYEKQLPSASAF